MGMPETVQIMGSRHIVLQPDLCTREQLAEMVAIHAGKEWILRRICAATVGLCTGLGATASASLPRHGFDVLAYGGQVLSYLREQGVELQEIVDAAQTLITPMQEARFPRQAEVDQLADFTEAGEGKRAG